MNVTVAAGILAFSVILGSCASHPKALSVHLADYHDKPMLNRLRVDMPDGQAPLYAETRSVLDDHDFRSVVWTDCRFLDEIAQDHVVSPL
jgi:hypothetical protein